MAHEIRRGTVAAQVSGNPGNTAQSPAGLDPRAFAVLERGLSAICCRTAMLGDALSLMADSDQDQAGALSSLADSARLIGFIADTMARHFGTLAYHEQPADWIDGGALLSAIHSADSADSQAVHHG